MESYQTRFFETLIGMYHKRSDALQSISQILQVSLDAVYRRVRNETIISPDEMEKLALHHNISLDQLMNQNRNDVVFQFNSFSSQVNTFEDFLSTLIATINQIKFIPNGQVLYASSEIPVFYQVIVPRFFAFKLYVWARTVWNFPQFQNRPFEFSLIPASVQLQCKEVFDLYKDLPSTELWSSGIFENTFSQIEHHLHSNKFKQTSDALLLLDDLEKICMHMREMAYHGKKFVQGTSPSIGEKITLFHNEMVYTNNTILFISPNLNMLFSTICNPNFIVSKDARICDYLQNWFDAVKNKSIQISEINEKGRSRFFDGILRKIDIMRRKTEIYILEEA
jgi:hypothetical protein